jgi:hypothetical protein
MTLHLSRQPQKAPATSRSIVAGRDTLRAEQKEHGGSIPHCVAEVRAAHVSATQNVIP